MASPELVEKELLDLIRKAAGHPDLPPIDLGLSGRTLIDHVIGRFEQVIEENGGYAHCPEVIKEGYGALKKLYPLYFK